MFIMLIQHFLEHHFLDLRSLNTNARPFLKYCFFPIIQIEPNVLAIFFILETSYDMIMFKGGGGQTKFMSRRP